MTEKKNDLLMIAKTSEGLEEALAAELGKLGAKEITPITRAVSFKGDKELMYSVNYRSRLCLRLLMPIATFEADDEQQLYEGIKAISWEDYLDLESSFAIDSVISYSAFTHSGYVSLKSKDAIVDRFREKQGKRPGVDTDNPDLLINIHIFRNRCTVSLDSSGSSLHLRGYRKYSVEAPANEVLAAGLIHLSGWDMKTPFMDPMCGSGTILMEAAMMASNIPAGYYRESYGFQRWKDYDEKLWKKVKEDADARRTDTEVPFLGADNDRRAFRAASSNIRGAGLDHIIRVRESDFFDSHPPFAKGCLVTNPPYGERLELDDIVAFYKGLGDQFKRNYAGFTVWVLVSNLEAAKFIGLRPTRKIKLFNGPLECRFLKFEVYEGSKRRG